MTPSFDLISSSGYKTTKSSDNKNMISLHSSNLQLYSIHAGNLYEPLMEVTNIMENIKCIIKGLPAVIVNQFW